MQPCCSPGCGALSVLPSELLERVGFFLQPQDVVVAATTSTGMYAVFMGPRALQPHLLPPRSMPMPLPPLCPEGPRLGRATQKAAGAIAQALFPAPTSRIRFPGSAAVYEAWPRPALQKHRDLAHWPVAATGQSIVAATDNQPAKHFAHITAGPPCSWYMLPYSMALIGVDRDDTGSMQRALITVSPLKQDALVLLSWDDGLVRSYRVTHRYTADDRRRHKIGEASVVALDERTAVDYSAFVLDAGHEQRVVVQYTREGWLDVLSPRF